MRWCLLLVLTLVDNFDRAKTAFRKAFKEGDAQAQRDAVRSMGKFDRVDAAELLAEAWHDSDVRLRNKGDAEVERKLRDAIALTIGSFAEKVTVRYLSRLLRAHDSITLREVLAAAAWRLGGDDMKEALLAVAAKEKSALVLSNALVSLRAMGVGEARTVYVDRLGHPHWRVRREAMKGALALDAVEAIAPLIELLRDDGLFKDEINEALVRLTGVDKHGDFATWSDWWSKQRDFEKKRPALKDRLAALEKPKPSGTVAVLYGTRVASKRVIFLVDLSGSMTEKATWQPEGESGQPPPRIGTRKIDVARYELKRAIGRLPADGSFNVLTYEKKVKKFADAMAPATKENRDELYAWMDAWETEGGTDTWGGLESALGVAGVTRSKLDADTIYLITDGKPTLGTPEWILGKVREKNEAGKIIIHAVGVGNDLDAEFLERLAEENGGSCTIR